MRTTVIAEIGSCHDMNTDLAKRLIDTAKACDADVAKFQYWSSATRMAQRRNAWPYLSVYQQYGIPVWWLAEMHAHCETVGIGFMCSTYLPEDVDVVAPFVETFKIASFEANDPQHLVAHVKHHKPIIVSLGMGADANIVRHYLRVPNLDENATSPLTFLHCVSAYPAPVAQLNLLRLRGRGGPFNWFPRYDGLSDHSAPEQMWTGALAVAAGARVIERHLHADDTEHANPDYGHSMSPRDFQYYVANIRYAEIALGDENVVGSVEAEAPMRAYRVRD
jgi:sialic acid synthase SpsE